MRILDIVSLLLLIVTLCPAVAQTTDEEAAVWGVVDSYLQTVKHPDPPAVDPEVFAEDVVAFWSDGTVLEGREALLQLHEEALAEVAENFSFFGMGAENVEIHVVGDAAWITCNFRLAGTLIEGEEYQRRTRASIILEKRDGAWQVVHEHSSRVATDIQ